MIEIITKSGKQQTNMSICPTFFLSFATFSIWRVRVCVCDRICVPNSCTSMFRKIRNGPVNRVIFISKY